MQSLVAINESIFIGMNDKYPAHELPAGVFQLLQNVVIDSNRLLKRPGTSTSSQISTATVENGGSTFEPNGGSKMQIVSVDGASNAQLYKSTDGISFSAIGSANLTKSTAINFVQAANFLFGFNGIEVVDLASDGTTVTKNRSGVPIGTFGFWFHNYLFVAGVSGNPNRLYWSNLGDPTTFSGANFVDINANDGDSITGLNAFNDDLVVGKNNSFWTITGFSGATFSTNTIAGQNSSSPIYGFGTPSHKAMVSAGRFLYYLSFVGGIPHIRTLQRSLYGTIVDGGIISMDVEGTLKALNNQQLTNASAAYDGKYLYFALPSSSSQVNDTVLVYYPELGSRGPWGPIKSWVKWTGIMPGTFFLSKISGVGKIYFTDAGTTGKVFHLDSSVSTDNGTVVSMDVKSRDFMLDKTGPRKAKYKYIYWKFKSGSAGTAKVLARLSDAANFTLQDTVSLAGNSPGLGSFILGTSVLGGQSTVEHRTTLTQMTDHLLGIEFTESTANSCEIYDFQLLGFMKALRNG